MNLISAQRLARRLMREHKLSGWKFAFDRAVRRFGCCRWREKKITLSAKLTALNDEPSVRDTILHEIAHALAGPKAGHGRVWKSHALAIGCSAMRCYGDEVVAPRGKYQGTCPTCRRTIWRNRRKRVSCGHCDKRFNPAHAFVWSCR